MIPKRFPIIIMIMINKKVMASLALLRRIGTRLPVMTLSFGFTKQTNLEKLVKGAKEIDEIIPEISKPREPDGGVYSVDRVVDRQ